MVLHPSLTCYITWRCIRNSEIHHEQGTVIHMSSQQEESPVQKRFHLKVTYYRRRLIWGWHIIGVLPRPSGATMVLFANALSLVVGGSFALTSAIVVHSLLQLDVHKVYWMYTKFSAIGCRQYLFTESNISQLEIAHLYRPLIAVQLTVRWMSLVLLHNCVLL